MDLRIVVLVAVRVLAGAEDILSNLHHRGHGAELRLIIVDARLHEVVGVIVVDVSRFKPVPVEPRISDLFLHIRVGVHLLFTWVLSLLISLILAAIVLLFPSPQLRDELADPIEDALALLPGLRRRLLAHVLLLHERLDAGGDGHGGPLLVLIVYLFVVVCFLVGQGAIELLCPLKILE